MAFFLPHTVRLASAPLDLPFTAGTLRHHQFRESPIPRKANKFMKALTLDTLPDLPQIAVLTRIATRLWADSTVLALWLGGSIARGKADAHSDIDLRVAVSPDALPEWLEPGMAALSALIGETVVGVHALRWDRTVLHQALLADGVIIDLLVQSVDRDPPQDVTLVLGCRDDAFGTLLASAALPEVEEAGAADPQAILEAITQFWIGSHKHTRMLFRHLDLMILQGLALEQPVLLRLWFVEATGRDQSSLRPTIHTLTPMMRAVTEVFGAHSLEVLGSARTSRAEIVGAIEANRNEVAAVGRRLAARLGFEYPDALEQTARQNLTQYLEDSAGAMTAVPEFGQRLAGRRYVPRPGAYALLVNAQGEIAVMETPRGGFLPGGGAEGEETPAQTLRREVREECGLEVGTLKNIGEAVQYVYTPGNEDGIRKECTFFQASVAAAAIAPMEPGHVLRWLTPSEAQSKLAHESQAWAVRQATGALRTETPR